MYARMNGGFETFLGKRVMIFSNNGANWSSRAHPYESVVTTEQSGHDIFTMG